MKIVIVTLSLHTYNTLKVTKPLCSIKKRKKLRIMFSEYILRYSKEYFWYIFLD